MARSFPQDFFEPFDMVYQLVTGKIEEHRNRLFDQQLVNWLGTLVEKFQAERSLWPEMIDGDYFRECSRFNQRVLHLVSCAYLHIAYDLPRYLAKEWPMAPGDWEYGPSEDDAESTYFGLTWIFPETFEEMAAEKKVMGRWRLITRFAPKGSLAAAGHWALHLRTAAWIHARRLKNHSGSARKQREDMMLDAMVMALKHVNDSRPWTAGTLNPPHGAFGASAALAVISGSDLAPGLLAFVGALIGSLAVFFWWRGRQRFERLESESVEFIEEFGRRVIDYLDVAVQNPEGFDSYVAERAPKRREAAGNRGEATSMR